MFVIGNFLGAFADLLDWVLWALQIVIFLRVVFSWVNADPYNGIVRAVYMVSEPFLRPIRKVLPPWKMGGWDLSPLIAILALHFTQYFLIRTLLDLAARLR